VELHFSKYLGLWGEGWSELVGQYPDVKYVYNWQTYRTEEFLIQETSNTANANFWNVCLMAWRYYVHRTGEATGTCLYGRAKRRSTQANQTQNLEWNTKKSRWYGWQNKTLRGLCFVRSWTGQLGLNLPNKRVVKTLNEVEYVKLGGGGGGGDCSAVIACWQRDFKCERQRKMQKQSVLELKIKTDYY
jgi:hypothetical protein